MIKAKIYAAENNVLNKTDVFSVMFNPNEIQLTENNLCNIGMQDSVHLSNVTLITTLYFNTMDTMRIEIFSDVRNEIKRFDKFKNQNYKAVNALKQICFSWGSICIIGLLQSMDVTYNLFASDGTPVRAKASIQIEGRYFGE